MLYQNVCAKEDTYSPLSNLLIVGGQLPNFRSFPILFNLLYGARKAPKLDKVTFS